MSLYNEELHGFAYIFKWWLLFNYRKKFNQIDLYHVVFPDYAAWFGMMGFYTELKGHTSGGRSVFKTG